VSKAKLDLPEPDKPVITTKACLGMSKSMFLRLCVRAPRTDKTVLGNTGREGIMGFTGCGPAAGRRVQGNPA
jgi:hypothetical protein